MSRAMCSVQEEGDLDPVLEKTATSTGGKRCMKCGGNAVTIARTKDPFCKDCFNVYFTHRFRSVLGKSRVITSGEKVLLTFSGGLSSRVLLALVEEGLSDRVRKKLNFSPSVIYIDEGAILGQELIDRCQYTTHILGIMSQCGLPSYFTQLEQVFGSCEVYTVDQLHCGLDSNDPVTDGNSISVQVDQASISQDSASVDTTSPHGSEKRAERENIGDTCQDSEGDVPRGKYTQLQASASQPNRVSTHQALPGATCKTDQCLKDDIYHKILTFMKKRDHSLETQLTELFKNTKSLTAKENLLISLRHQLLVNVARKYGFTKVVVGDNATRLAVRLLGNIAQGRGATLPLDTGFVDSRSTDIVFVRPLREFPTREVATHVVLNNLSTMTTPNLATLAPEKASIETLTESFINGLQVDFPSTTNTIFRTGDKLTVRLAEGQNGTASCCLCQAPLGEIDDDSVFTHLRLPETKDTTISKDVWGQLCYGCRLTVKDMKQGTRLLPPFVHTTFEDEPLTCTEHLETTRESMKAQIQEFLLDESS